MYKDTKLLFKGPTYAEVVKRHPAGVCSSFAMDWLKKLLANKPINESTYGDVGRIKKLVKRQEKYEGKGGDLEVMATSYGLTIEHLRGIPKTPSMFDDAPLTPSAYLADLPAGYYYVSINEVSGRNHALGYNSHAGSFCDANIGIMDLKSASMAAMLAEADAMMAKDGLKPSGYHFYQVALIKKK